MGFLVGGRSATHSDGSVSLVNGHTRRGLVNGHIRRGLVNMCGRADADVGVEFTIILGSQAG